MPVNPDLRVENRNDIVLALLAAGGTGREAEEPVVGITRMMKLLFLLQQEAGIEQVLAPGEGYFDFEAYDMGPFDAEVYDSLEFLKDIDLVQTQTTEGHSSVEDAVERGRVAEEGDFEAPDETEYTPPEEYSLTESGKEVAQHLLAQLRPDIRQAMEAVKKEHNQRPLRELLRYVYLKYPDAASRSKIKRQLGL